MAFIFEYNDASDNSLSKATLIRNLVSIYYVGVLGGAFEKYKNAKREGVTLLGASDQNFFSGKCTYYLLR